MSGMLVHQGEKSWRSGAGRTRRIGSFLLYPFLVVCGGSLAVGAVFASFYVGLAFLLAGVLLTLIAQSQLPGKALADASLAAFMLGVVVAALIYFGYMGDYGEPFWVPGADDQVFEQVATRLYNGHFATVFDMFASSDSYLRQHNSKGWVMGLVYLMHIGDALDGYHSMVPRILNVFVLNALAMVVVKCFARRYATSEKWLCIMYLSLALMPNALVISSHIYRDTVSAFLVVGCYFLALEICERRAVVRNVVLIGVFAYCSYWLRSMNLFFIAGLVAAAVLPPILKRLKTNVAVVGAAIVAAAAGLVLFAGYGDQMIAYISRYGDRIASGESRFVSLIYGLPLLPIGLPLRMVAYLCSPFYYRILFDPASWFASTESITHLLATVGTIVLAAHYVYVCRGIREDGRTGLALLIVLVGICISTSGYRHIMMVYPLLVLLIAEGMYALKSEPEKRVVYRTAALLVGLVLCSAFGLVSLV